MQEKGSPLYQLFILALSIYVLIIVSAETFYVFDSEISLVLQRIDLAICMFFLCDFFLNLYRAESKREYLRWGWIDLLSSIPMVDPLRWGRLARVVRIVRVLRSLKSLRVIVGAIKKSRFETLSLLVVLSTFITYTVSAALILEMERDYGGSIDTANEALQWAFLNIMNAKISITQAQSQGGMIVTIVLNKLGLLLFAYINAVLIAWLIKNKSSDLVQK